jgi:hypothetical protein
MTASRESIYSALFALVSNSAPFKTKSRRLKLWTDVNAAQKPAIFIAQRGQTYVQGSTATPQKVTLKADIFIYTDAGRDAIAVPSAALNDLVDAVDAALAGDVMTGQQTLGGLVAHCWIEGEVMIDPGDLDGDGMAVIPVRILIP